MSRSRNSVENILCEGSRVYEICGGSCFSYSVVGFFYFIVYLFIDPNDVLACVAAFLCKYFFSLTFRVGMLEEGFMKRGGLIV